MFEKASAVHCTYLRLCRLITTEVTEELVGADVLKSGMVALKMTQGNFFKRRHFIT